MLPVTQTASDGNVRLTPAASLPQCDEAERSVPSNDSDAYEDDFDEDYATTGDLEGQTDLDVLIEDIGDIIDRLYKISTKIRNSATRTLSPKALYFKEVDPLSGVDLFDQFADLDERHIREVLRAYQPDNPLVGASFLVKRLGQANTRRRKQFRYWRAHREKMARATAEIKQSRTNLPEIDPSRPERAKTVLGDEPRIVVSQQESPSLTTATRLDPVKIKMDDQESIISISSYAPSIQGSDETVQFPLPTPNISKGKYFECPYCFTLCSSVYLQRKAWR